MPMNITTLTELNEALRNSFLAIKDDMNSLRQAISEQQSHTKELAGHLAIMSQRMEQELKNMRNSQAVGTNEQTHSFKSLMDTQIEALQSQILILREEMQNKTEARPQEKNTKKIEEQLSRQINEKFIEIMSVVQEQTDSLQRRNMQLADDFKKELGSVRGGSLAAILTNIQSLSTQVERLDENSRKIAHGHKKLQDVENELLLVKQIFTQLQQKQSASEETIVQMRTDLQKRISLESEAATTRLSLAHAKNQEEMRLQIKEIKEQLKHILQVEAPVTAITERLKTIDSQFAVVVEKANREFSLIHKQLEILQHQSAQGHDVSQQLQSIKEDIERHYSLDKARLDANMDAFRNQYNLQLEAINSRVTLLKTETEENSNTLRHSLETIRENMVYKEAFETFQKDVLAHNAAMSSLLTQKMDSLRPTLTKMEEEGAKKKEVGVLKEELSSIAKTIKEQADMLNNKTALTEKLIAQTKKELKETIDTRAKELTSSLTLQGTNIAAQQKIITKMTEQIKDLRELEERNEESSKRLNKLIRQFAQLKEIPLEEKNFLSSFHELFRKKETKEPASIQELNTSLQSSMQKLEAMPPIITPKMTSEKTAAERKRKQDKLGVITKIGLEEGLITEKDL